MVAIRLAIGMRSCYRVLDGQSTTGRPCIEELSGAARQPSRRGGRGLGGVQGTHAPLDDLRYREQKASGFGPNGSGSARKMRKVVVVPGRW